MLREAHFFTSSVTRHIRPGKGHRDLCASFATFASNLSFYTAARSSIV
jgi:hypothetical protein